MSDLHADILQLGDAFGEHRRISHWRVSFLINGDGQFLARLKSGKSCTLRTAKRVMQSFSDQWPADLDWPADIPRPQTDKSGRAA